jgi:O-6-methylguanine DNA methyltransferase
MIMPPQEKNKTISIFYYKSPFCALSFKADERGVFFASYTKLRPEHNGFDFSTLRMELDAYFSGNLKRFSVKLVYDRATFSGKVLTALSRVPYGRVISYSDLAARAGFPGAARAVGTVMAKNPLPLLIPCHRVIKADGSTGQFGGGVDLKKKLLDLEGTRFKSG